MANYYQNPRKILGKRKKINYKKTLIKALIVLILFSGLISLFYIPKFRIKNISIQSGSALNEKIAEAVREELSKKIFLMIPNDNIFLLRKKGVAKLLGKNFPQIKSMDLDKDFPNGLNITFEEKQKNGIYCLAGTEGKDEKCFFIDENGFGSEEVIPEEAHGLMNEKKIIVFQKEDVSDFKTGDEFLKKEEFAPILKFMENAKTLGLKTEKAVFKNGILHSYEIYFEEGWRVLLDKKILESDETAFQNLKLLLDSKLKDKRKSLEYIDLRFANKAFYKLK